MQIGPKIRVGGTLGKIGEGIKKGAGKVLSNPITQLGAGALLGPLGAAGVGALGGALSNKGVGGTVSGAVGGGLAGLGGAKLGGLLGGLKGALGVGGGPALPNIDYGGIQGALGANGVTGGAGGLMGGLKTALGVGQSGWAQPLLGGVGGAAGAVLDARQQQAALDQRRSEFDRNYEMEKGTYDRRMASDSASAPIKAALIQALLGRTGVQMGARR